MTPRVHVTDARVEAGTVEVVVADHGGAGVGGVEADALAARALRRGGRPERRRRATRYREREFLARVDAGRVELCLTPAAAADPNTDVACFSANLFNEFSTVDAGVVWGDRVVFRFWLRDVDEATCRAARRSSDWTSTGPTTASARRRSRTSSTGRCPAQSPAPSCSRCPTGGGSALPTSWSSRSCSTTRVCRSYCARGTRRRSGPRRGVLPESQITARRVRRRRARGAARGPRGRGGDRGGPAARAAGADAGAALCVPAPRKVRRELAPPLFGPGGEEARRRLLRALLRRRRRLPRGRAVLRF